jgi:DMSO/TMAO reductase YedYZ molybdopterin-dependent catalytic subunit/glyoxylase-like metal-dependent hydrolase (beta-lactamase superfamily II)/rhodanese-related sulfurtransferase
MILKQYYLGCLAHASYLVADEPSQIAAVIDPQRDVDTYIEDAHRLGCRIGHVFLTHFHADFVAGHLELRDRERARIYLGALAEAEFEFKPLGDGEGIGFGAVRLEVLQTPGHSPESISILVYDLDSDQRRPHAVLSGDTLFIGDVGRPDLRASMGWTAEQLGGMLYDSLHSKLLTLPDETLVYPAHGAGSLCGKNLSTDTVSTIGVQRRYNYALQPMSRDEFVRVVTADQPEAPAYFSYDAVLNTKERPTLEQALAQELRPLSLSEALGLVSEGAVVLDSRDCADFAGAHLAGSVNIGLGGSYATWAGTILDRERPLVVVADLGRETEAAMRLGRIGFDNVAGFLEGGMQAADPRPDLLARIERVTAVTLAEQLTGSDPPLILDVRAEHEWQQERLAGSVNIPLGQLTGRLDELPGGRPLVVHCETGYRSSIAASLLRREGREQIIDLVGGIDAWRASRPNGAGAANAVVKERPRIAPPAAGKDLRLVMWSEQPLNAETPLELLSESELTPNELFFVRSHGPIPEVDPAAFRLTVRGLVGEPLTLSLEDLRQQFERLTLEAVLVCAGNRRSELAAIAPIPGQAPWGPGAAGNARWGGVPLRAVLQAAGLETGAGHVAFTGLDRCTEEGEVTPFGGSIPLTKALAPEVLLADEMNGKPLPPAHGYPLRVIVPGYIGARSVKWLTTITVQSQPSTNYFQARTYRLYPSAVRSESVPEQGFSLGETPVNAVICEPGQDAVVNGPRVLARGYALTGGTREIERVEITLDRGATFTTARLLDQHHPGAWRRWETELELDPGVHELAVRAWDSAASTQPESPEGLWNLKGYINNSWHRARFTVTHRPGGGSAGRAVP